jgi:hypothetical protein
MEGALHLDKVMGAGSVAEQRKRLKHVYWMGGSPCAGKSSMSALLAAQYGFFLYQVDAALPAQMGRLNAADHPVLTAWMGASCEERWMQPMEALVQEAVACYGEHFSLVVEDLLALPADRPILAEGTALLPQLVARFAEPGRAVWVVPTAEFQREHYARRGFVAAILADCADPDAAFRNWMARDALFAQQVQQEAAARGFPTLVVDGTQNVEQNAAQIERVFAGLGAGR